MINLKELNVSIHYTHFKFHYTHFNTCSKKVIARDYKINLKRAYFNVPFHPKLRKYPKFLWNRSIYEFLYLSYGLGPAPLVFIKPMKIFISLLRKLYRNNMLLTSKLQKNFLEGLDSLIFLLQQLGSVIYKENLNFSQCRKYSFWVWFSFQY